MEIVTTLFVATGLAMDAFAVSLGIGTTRQAEDRRARFRLAFHFGVFQSLMTVLGWLAGSTIAQLISQYDHWIALALLGYVGGDMIRSGFSNDVDTFVENPSKGKTLIMLCIATSLDAMAVGLGMAMVKSDIIFPAFIIGIVTLVLSTFGLLVGGKLGQKFGKRMEIIGGLILIGIGLNILISHLTS